MATLTVPRKITKMLVIGNELAVLSDDGLIWIWTAQPEGPPQWEQLPALPPIECTVETFT